jgi:hypothetical protein
MASTLHARFESSGCLPVRISKTPCVCSSCWQRRGTSHCIVDACQAIGNYPESLNGRCGPCWDVSSWALNDMEVILSSYFQWTFFLVLLCGTSVYGVSVTFSYTPYKPLKNCAETSNKSKHFKDECKAIIHNTTFGIISRRRHWKHPSPPVTDFSILLISHMSGI